MGKYLFIFGIIFSVLCYSEETPHFIYADAHTMGGYPMAGAGVRAQRGVHGFDFSANICPIRVPYTLKIFHARSLYLCYPVQKGFYFGAGVGILNEPETVKFCGSFESSIGYQWSNHIFLEGSATLPFKEINKVCPCITLGYGF